jgi:hypothetical protein
MKAFTQSVLILIAVTCINQLASAAEDSTYTLECKYKQTSDAGKKEKGTIVYTFSLPYKQVFRWDRMEWNSIPEITSSTLVLEAYKSAGEIRETSINRFSGAYSSRSTLLDVKISRTGECKKVKLKVPPAPKF